MSNDNQAGQEASTPAFNPFNLDTMALQTKRPFAIARMVSLSICFMALLTIAYAYFSHIDVVVTVQGRVIPAGKSKVVQPLETGIVKTIAVKDGQHVKAGDVLVELDPTNPGADSERLGLEVALAQADAQRLGALSRGVSTFSVGTQLPADLAANQQAMLNNRLAEQSARLASIDADIAKKQADVSAIQASLTQIKRSLPLVQKKHDMRVDLAKTGHIAETGLIETQLELVNLEKEMNVQSKRLLEGEAGLNASQKQRAQAVAEFNSKVSSEIAEAGKRRDATQQELKKANQRKELQVLRAPIDGVVQQLAVTTVGGVVTQAQALMTIVPENSPFEVEAQVINKDIGQLKVGQRVINKIETFDFTRFGYIDGEILWIGGDAVMDQKLGPVYPIRIKLNATQVPNIVNGSRGKVAAGMSVMSDIKTDQRRMIEYFLAPMLRYKEESLRER